MDRQAYYRAQKRVHHKKSIAQKVVELVKEERVLQPKMGTRKLYHRLLDSLKGLKVGRDKLFSILKANHLDIHPRRS